MIAAVDCTHDPKRRSWVDAANLPDCDFPIQNLPFASFRRAGSDETLRIGVAIGDQILDLRALNARGVAAGLDATALAACCEPTLNRLMALSLIQTTAGFARNRFENSSTTALVIKGLSPAGSSVEPPCGCTTVMPASSIVPANAARARADPVR